MAEQPLVSVAVSTYNRARTLPNLIAALERQTLPKESFEVVIADNGSTDDTAAVLESLASASSIDLRPVRVDVNRGPARGRNAAWRATRASVVAFTDDDCLPQPGWLEQGLAAMIDADIVAGRTEPDPSQLDLLGPYARTVWPSFAKFFPTCNVFFRRSDLDAVGGFDESFVGTGGEDTDLALRTMQLGRRAAFVDDALVYHEVKPGSFRQKLKETVRWVDLPRIIAKHPSMRRDYLYRRYFWKRTHPRTLLALFGLVLVPILTPLAIICVLPWYQMRAHNTPTRSLPGLFVVDVLEVLVMVRGSLRHRTLLL
jgi:glycosyltransferase involved in cell wall biosynthesis